MNITKRQYDAAMYALNKNNRQMAPIRDAERIYLEAYAAGINDAADMMKGIAEVSGDRRLLNIHILLRGVGLAKVDKDGKRIERD